MKPNGDADLLQGYLAGDLSDVDLSNLIERLKSDPQLARDLIVLSHEEAVLREWAKGETAAELVNRTVITLPIRAVPSPYRFAGRMALAATILLLALVGLYISFFRIEPVDPMNPSEKEIVQNESQPIARLADWKGDVVVVTGKVKRPVEMGQDLFLGQKLSTRGGDSFAVVVFKDSSRVELDENTTVSLEHNPSKNRKLAVQEGSIAAEVAPQPAGLPMIITTPHAYFESGGSRVSVLAQNDETQIEAEEGKIELTTADGKTLSVNAGSTAMVTKAGHSIRPSNRKTKGERSMGRKTKAPHKQHGKK